MIRQIRDPATKFESHDFFVLQTSQHGDIFRLTAEVPPSARDETLQRDAEEPNNEAYKSDVLEILDRQCGVLWTVEKGKGGKQCYHPYVPETQN